jgi:hypothetical protein
MFSTAIVTRSAARGKPIRHVQAMAATRSKAGTGGSKNVSKLVGM